MYLAIMILRGVAYGEESIFPSPSIYTTKYWYKRGIFEVFTSNLSGFLGVDPENLEPFYVLYAHWYLSIS